MKELEYPFDSLYIRQKKKKIKKELLEKGSFVEKKIAILSGSTIGEIKPILELFLLNQGIYPTFFEGQYNRYYEEAVFETGEIKAFSPDFIYLHTTIRNLLEGPKVEDSKEKIEEKIKICYERFFSIWEKLRTQIGCPIIQNNFEMPFYRLFGNRDCVFENGLLHFVEEINHLFYGYASEKEEFYMNDIHYLSSWYGLERWYDLPSWYVYKYAFSQDAIPLVCHNIANIIKAAFGKNKKVLVVDLDHTLWGGVIGEEGVEGIKLGVESPEGMPFRDFQEYIKNLSKMGIPLAICSKNELDAAKEGFAHPSSVLSQEDFIIIKANWEKKSSNILEIANEINVLTDSIVFADDNQAEQAEVEQGIGDLIVLPLDLPENYVKILDKGGYFETTTLSCEDRKRIEYYKGNQKRHKAESIFTDYHEFLKNLNMCCLVEEFKKENWTRVTQLINKTNQFNLTTKRVTEEEVKNFSRENITLCGNLSDRYGNNGIVTAIMVECNGEVGDVIVWIMSCRVFKRNLEYAMFDQLREVCKKRNIKILKGYYYPTPKNHLVENFYKKLGFAFVQKSTEQTIWEYSMEQEWKPLDDTIHVKTKIE